MGRQSYLYFSGARPGLAGPAPDSGRHDVTGRRRARYLGACDIAQLSAITSYSNSFEKKKSSMHRGGIMDHGAIACQCAGLAAGISSQVNATSL